ncbi:putative type IX secretion system sortase PorU2 [Tellurirhabdus rosea]|uniref:putative type IX secretion system sortase PorU2 n=1 Tax=Tellurirhabdus rosea TaxID=2674997 RepID=UPI00224F9981|nr:C25 family cysteine peptidase [Tellurirhabdus rosea]
MIRFFAVLISFLSVNWTLAQSARYGNEWIQFDQSYYRIPVAEKGLYRLTTEDLRRAGLPIASLDPATLQLFHRGVEQPVIVTGEADGRLDAADFLQFSGEGNDGALDSLLYRPAGTQPHPFYSMFSDTAAYFLTWSRTGTKGKRLINRPEPPSGPDSLATRRLLLTQEYSFRDFAPPTNRHEVYFEPGEGWTGPIQQKGIPFVQRLRLDGWVASDPRKPELALLLNGRDNSAHEVAIYAGKARRLLGLVRFSGFRTPTFRAVLEPDDLDADSTLTVSTVSQGPDATDRYSVSYLQVRYPHGAEAAPPAEPRTPRLERVHFRRLAAARPNYLIVSHESLMQPVGVVPDAVRAYAAYRASVAGGRYDTLVVTFRELMNQFSYGERSPLALRRFADYMLSADSATRRERFLLLIGRSNAYFPVRRNPAQDRLDALPTLAYMPGSDVSLTAGLAGFPDYVHAIPTGRLNTLNPQEVLHYLAKVQEYEQTPATAAWRKQLLHLSGGRNAFEQEIFRRITDAAAATAAGAFLGASVTTRSKQTNAPVEKVEAADVVNRGVGLLTVFGHSSPVITDTDLGYVSQPANGYRNRGRYPLLFFNGCGIGNIFFGATNNLSTDWLLAPDKGAIAVLAHGYTGFVGQLDNFTRVFYETLLGDSLWMPRPIGLVHQETARRMVQRFPNELDLANVSQMIFQGDPALRLFPLARPDFVLPPEGLFFGKADNAPDSVRLHLLVANAGRFHPSDKPAMELRQETTPGNWQAVLKRPGRAVAFRDTLSLAFRPEPIGGRTAYEIVIDPENRISELDETNNRLWFETVFENGKLSLTLPDSGQRFPPDRLNPLLEVTIDGARLPDGALVSPEPLIQLVLWDNDRYRIRADTVGLDILLKRPCPGCEFERVRLGGPQVNWQPAGPDNRFRLDYRPGPLTDGLYTLRVSAADVAGNPAGTQPYQIRFRVRTADSLSTVRAVPNPFRFRTRFSFALTGPKTPESATLFLYSADGQLVRQIRQSLRIGDNGIDWDGSDAGGALLPAGRYWFRLVLDDGRQKGGSVFFHR